MNSMGIFISPGLAVMAAYGKRETSTNGWITFTTKLATCLSVGCPVCPIGGRSTALARIVALTNLG